MGLKYTLLVNSQKKQDWLVEIDVPSYEGDPIQLVGDRNPISLDYSGGGNDNVFDSHIISQSLTLRVYDDNVDIEELQLIDDASVTCRSYLNGQLKHQGFIISDGVQEPDSGVSSLITIQSIDGLSLLDAIPFVWGDNYGLITVDGQQSVQRCPMNAIRLALYRPENLNNILPIRWATSLKSEQYPLDDMLAGRNRIIYDGKMLTYGDYSAHWYLNEIMKTANCWLYQRDGYWWIENRGDTIRNGGLFNGYEITSSTTAQVATPISIDLNTTDLANEFIDGDQYWMMKKPLGGVNVTYEDTTNDNNVIPNGGFDLSVTAVVADWRMSDGSVIPIADPINGRADGHSGNIDSRLNGTDRTVTTGSIPIDTSILFKNALLGFKWLPVSGYDLTPEGNIDFSKFPMWISVRLDTGTQDLYLNEFGYWSEKNTEANAQVVSVTWSGIGTDTLTIQFDQARNFFVGDEVIVAFYRGTGGGGSGGYEAYRIRFDTTMSVQDGVNYIASRIPNASTPNAWSVDIFFVADSTENIAFTQKTNDYYKQVQIDGGAQMKLNDVLDIQFQSKGLSSNIKLPSALGNLTIEIYSKGGTQMYLDDAYFRVDDNHDKYEVRNTGSKSPVENYEVGISSSFSGHMWSNYMDNYSTSDLALNWTVAGGAGKSLTQLYGEFIMDWRNTPRKIFDGSIDRIVQAGDFLTIKGRKYVVMNATIQGDGITRVLAFEAVLNPISYNVTHKGTIENNT